MKTRTKNTIFFVIVPCIEDSVRLVNLEESNPSQLAAYNLIKDTVARGVVEVCQNSSFVSVCEESWVNREASVLCNQLGFSSYGENRLTVKCNWIYLFCHYRLNCCK